MKLQIMAPATPIRSSLLKTHMCSKADFKSQSANPNASCHCWETLPEHFMLTEFTNAILREEGNR